MFRNPDRTEFVVFGSHAQLRELDPYLPVGVFGDFVHPAVIVGSLGVWFGARFSFAGRVRSICGACFVRVRGFERVGEHLDLATAMDR